MYAYIDPENHPNVGKYAIHEAFGNWQKDFCRGREGLRCPPGFGVQNVAHPVRNVVKRVAHPFCLGSVLPNGSSFV